MTDDISTVGKDEKPSKRNIVKGAVLAFSSGLLFTANHVVIQHFSLSFADVSLVRYLVQSVSLLILIKLSVCYKKCQSSVDSAPLIENVKNTVDTKLWVHQVDPARNIQLVRLLLILQGICNGIFTLGAFICVSNMPLGDFSAIIFSTPLPTMILAALFLKQRLRLYRLVCGTLLVVGLVLVVRPPSLFAGQVDSTGHGVDRKDGYYTGALMGLVGTVAGAAHFVLVSILYANQSTSSARLLVFHAGLGGLLVSLVSTVFDCSHKILSPDIVLISPVRWAAMFFVAVAGVLGFLMLNQAVKLTNPVLVSFIRVSEIVVSYFIQVFLYGQQVDMFGIAGSICVTVAVVLVPLEQFARKCLPSCLHKII